MPLADSRRTTKTSRHIQPQLERLTKLAKGLRRNETGLLREALDDGRKKYDDQLKDAPAG